jgi:exodeoxyribonuclease V gamma subunit
MIKVYESHDLIPLAEVFSQKRKQESPRNPLLPEQIVVQNSEMSRWLTAYLSEKEGIAANLNFMFPAELFWEIIRIMNPDIPERLPSDRGPMSWSIFGILQSTDDSALSVLHQYINHEESHIREMRRWDLACRISDVFDQYLSYRPGMILAWEKNQLVTGFSTERWQAHLWRELINNWQNKAEMHRPRLQERFFTAVENGSFPAEKLTSSLTVFGKIDVPSSFFKVISQLEKVTDINFYNQKAAVHQEQVLVKSLNKKGREFGDIFNKYVARNDVSCDCQQLSGDQRETKRVNFFNTLRKDIQAGPNKEGSFTADSSFQVHSCHSAQREVEVLYDQLLCLLDNNMGLNPADILIISPEIEKYAAEIEAVFGAPGEGVPKIPFHISGISENSDPFEAGFKKLLKLVDSRFKVTDVIGLLECKPVSDKLNLSEEDLIILNRWIDENYIRWGIDGIQKQSLNLPASNNFTWQSGLHSMFAGFAMEPEGDTLLHGIYPYEEIGQTDHGLLLGKLSQFMHQLFQCHKQVQEPKPPEEWSRILREWLFHIFNEEPANYTRLNGLIQLIDGFAEETNQAGREGEISYQIVCDYLENQLEDQPAHSRRNGEGVTFCSMNAMRGIPAKIVGMIGMNDGAFPQSKTVPDFDLIVKDPKKGDRSAAKDGRQLFLEAILAATEGIYFSFVGQSDSTDAEYPPSAVLQELIDYISEYYSIDENELIREHRLQPFSPHYFKNSENGYFSYSSRNQKAAEQLNRRDTAESTFIKEPLPEPDDVLKKITLTSFVGFFQHPAKFLLNRRLGIYLHQDEYPDEDREPFTLSALEKSRFDRELGNRFLKDQSLESYYEVARAKNLLPEGWAGRQEYQQKLEWVNDFGEFIKSRVSGELLEPDEIYLQRDDFLLTGRLDSVYQGGQILYRFGKMRPKDLIELWIKHLLLQTVKPNDHSGESRFITRDDKNDRKGVSFKLLPPENSRRILEKLISIYKKGLRKNTLFFPAISYKYAESIFRKKKDEPKAVEAAKAEWTDSRRPYLEGDDPYNKCLMQDVDPLDNKDLASGFKQISRTFWEPFFGVLEKTKTSLS